MNKVILMGRLGSNPELKYTQSQTAVCNVSLATTEYRKNADGTGTDQTEWHRLVIWGKSAETMNRYCTKGSPLLVEGKISTRSYEKDGGKRYITEIVVDRFEFVPKTSDGGSTGQQSKDVLEGIPF